MTSGVLAKYFLFLRQTEVIRELLEGINRDWKTADDEELKIIKQHAYMGKRYSMFFAGEGYTRDETLKIYMLTRLRKTPVAVFIYLSTFGAMALHFSSTLMDIVLPLNETRLYKSPIVTEYFIDEQKYYFRIAVYQGLAILIGGTVYVATESLTFMWMMHSACLYRLVSYRINVAIVDSINDLYITEKTVNRNSGKSLTRSIMMHERSHTFLKDVKSAVTLVYSILLILGVTSLSTNLFSLSQSTLEGDNIEDTLISMMFVISEMGYMFYGNFVSQKMIDSGGDIFTDVYDTEWYKMPVSTQKLLMLVMLRSIKSPEFNMLLVFNASFEGFSMLLRTSVSYFTVQGRRNNDFFSLLLRVDELSSLKGMDFAGSRYYDLNRILLSVVGLWPYETTKLSKVQCFFTFVVLSSGITVQVRHLLDRIVYDWSTLTNEEELRIIHEYSRVTRMMTTIYSCICIICSPYIAPHLNATDIFTNDMIAVIIYTLLLIVTFSEFSNQILDILIPLNYSRPRKLIVKLEYFVDQQKYFYPIAMHATTVAIFGSTVLLATETLTMAIMQHICGLYKIISYRLGHTFVSNVPGVSVAERSFIVHRKVLSIVNLHRRVIKYIDLMRKNFTTSYVLLIALGMNSLILTIFLVSINCFNILLYKSAK
ncbi:uncharacterized protein LOC143371192 [Andrena cerasifolii]|uniref:uncharacterized protein LOC143371192 n=1 Tax=Andrena cerasifolii TaxID=2819439 RepID=UPI004037C8A2